MSVTIKVVRGRRTVALGLVIAAAALGAACKDKGKGDKPKEVPVTPRAVDAGAGPGVSLPPPPQLRNLKVLDQARVDALSQLIFANRPAIRPLCLAPKTVDPATINPDRSLFVHDDDTINALGPNTFSLQTTLTKLAADAVAAGAAGTTAETLFRDLWDTQNPRPSGATPVGSHCDDDGGTLNGFPNPCRPAEGAQAKVANLTAEIATYRPIALVNRLDLAAEGWKNCGEHRIVYARPGSSPIQRSFIIFEAVLPNPRPGCQSACRAVAERWYKLSSTSVAADRAKLLQELYYVGLPGFRPVVHFDHYTAKGSSSGYGNAGSGQIRTNQFLQGPWMLKEFKLALDCTVAPCVADVVPIPVKNNPHGELWTESAAAGIAHDFQIDVVEPQAAELGTGGLNDFSYQVPVGFDAARSDEQNPGLADNYRAAYTAVPGVPGGFRSNLSTKAIALGLNDTQLVNRATALSCAGCHQPSTFQLLATQDPNAIGPALGWPNSASFVHTRLEAIGGIHALSPALTDVFLPARKANLAAYLNARVCLCLFKLPRFIDLPRLERSIRPPRTLDDLRNAEVDLKRRIDVELQRQGQPALPSLELPAAAQPLILDEVKAAGADAVRQSLARARAVRKLVADEPPRKTVTGHFRVH